MRSKPDYVKFVLLYRVYKKNAPLYFLYISAPIKATEVVLYGNIEEILLFVLNTKPT